MERLTSLKKALLSAPTDRSIGEYFSDLDITLKDLRGTVLDLGSGRGEFFSRQAAVNGIEVISVNPMLITKQEREVRKDIIDNYDVPEYFSVRRFKNLKRIPDQKRSIAALAQALPFPDESFDTVVSLYAVPLWLTQNTKNLEEVFKEIYRVLKPGGKAFLGPIDSPRLKRTVLNRLKIPYQIKHTDYDEMLKQSGAIITDSIRNIYISKP